MNKEDLKEYKYNQQWIKGRLEYIEEYKTNITNITATLSDMPNGSRQVQDNMAEKLSVLNIKYTFALYIFFQKH